MSNRGRWIVADLDLDALEAVAENANDWGGWEIWPDLTEGGFVHVGNADGVIPEGEIATADDAEPNPIAKAYTPEIGEFIAALDPPTVLALIGEAKRTREAEAALALVARANRVHVDERDAALASVEVLEAAIREAVLELSERSSTTKEEVRDILSAALTDTKEDGR
jgi:hypothetical protein